MEVLARAGKRAAYHLLQAFVEALKAVEAVIEEVGKLGETHETAEEPKITRIVVE